MSHAARVLGPDGPFARYLDRYEARGGQLQMATAVERALQQEQVLLCEAGTGTGKTFAYLVPAIFSNKKIVISTATRALQEQLVHQDIPTVERALGTRVEATLLKGLGNYVCQRRFETFRTSSEGNSRQWANKLHLVNSWRRQTETGDIAELSALSERDELFSHITSSSDTRVGPRCSHYEECFVTRAKRAADAARIVVVNHHLFFADLALRGPHPGRVLPDYDAVVFDEAHQLEDTATLFFGVRVSRRAVRSLLLETERTLRHIPEYSLGTPRCVEQLEGAQQHFFDTLRSLLKDEPRSRLDADSWNDERRQRYFDLDVALEAVESTVEVARSKPEATRSRDVFEALESVLRRCRTVREGLNTIVEGAPGRVTWLEGESAALTLSSSPVDLSDILRERVFDCIPSVILTSATLATRSERPFAFIRQRLGVEECTAPVEELVVDSPFDFQNHSLLYLARSLPPPAAPEFLDEALVQIRQLTEASNGGAFVLTTSLRSMRLLHQRLRELLPERTVLVQGSAPKRALLDAFQSSGAAVLVATMSFWEGVDVPGQALRLVVLEKIPFAVPSDPLVQARASVIEERGGNAFRELLLPTAEVALKQGFGRLIRTERDRGVVAILDSRVLSKGYGQQLLRQLPPARRTVKLEQACAFLSSLEQDW